MAKKKLRPSGVRGDKKAEYYVFEMKKRSPGEPLRQVSSGPLPLREAKLFASLGAKGSARDRVVTTSPRKRGFKLLNRYVAGGTTRARPTRPAPMPSDPRNEYRGGSADAPEPERAESPSDEGDPS